MAKIRHIAICAQDPFKLAEFYKETFGMHEVQRMEKSVFVSDGYINLALLPASANDGKEGIAHFGFQVEDPEEIARRGKAAGAQTGIAPRPRDGRYAEFRIHDPVGTGVDLAKAGWAVEPESAEAMAARVEA
ncbi:MAG TPA: VOC family protein [Chloroflexota bacterium]|jgi:methylmalonyl-CoA/ethylmalonyl-CoA epimerase